MKGKHGYLEKSHRQTEVLGSLVGGCAGGSSSSEMICKTTCTFKTKVL